MKYSKNQLSYTHTTATDQPKSRSEGHPVQVLRSSPIFYLGLIPLPVGKWENTSLEQFQAQIF